MSVGRDSLYNIAGSVTPLALALLTIPFYIDAVGTERYGALAIAWLILGYFGLFDLGLGRATAQRIAALHDSSDEHRARVFWTAALVNIGIGVVGGILLYFGATYFFENRFQADAPLIEEALVAVPWLAMAVPVATLTGVASGALQGRKKFLDVNMATVAGASLFQLIPLCVAYVIGPELVGLIIAAIAARVIGLVLFLARTHKHLLRNTVPKLDKSEWLALLKFGGWVTVVSIISPMLVVIDRFFIGALISAVAVTLYTVPFEIVQRISILPRSIAMALFPRMAEASLEHGAQLAKRAMLVVNVIVTPVIIAAIFLIRPFLALWIGDDIAIQAGPIAIVLLIGYWANAFGIIPYSRLQAAGRPHVVTLVLLAQLPFYVAAMYWVITSFGLIGAAAVFSIRTVVDFVLLQRLSAGSLSIAPTLALCAGMVGVSAATNLASYPFSILWWLSGALVTLSFLALTIRRIPNELEAMANRFVPSIVGRHLRYV